MRAKHAGIPAVPAWVSNDVPSAGRVVCEEAVGLGGFLPFGFARRRDCLRLGVFG